jgi:hypothetical protein
MLRKMTNNLFKYSNGGQKWAPILEDENYLNNVFMIYRLKSSYPGVYSNSQKQMDRQ